jgi:hypothetical protein
MRNVVTALLLFATQAPADTSTGDETGGRFVRFRKFGYKECPKP